MTRLQVKLAKQSFFPLTLDYGQEFMVEPYPTDEALLKSLKNRRNTMQQTLTIGKLAKRSNVSIDSIRFYERRGLLAEPMRTESNYRRYPLEAAAQLRFIKKAQNLGFSLDEIKGLLKLQHDPAASKADIKAKTEAKIAMVLEKIQDLTRMLAALEKLNKSCNGHGSIEECPILEALAADDGQECHH
jgi:Hg(II)-responsive transcriptional regulator